MQKSSFRTTLLAVTAASVLSLVLLTTSSADDIIGNNDDDSESIGRIKDIVEAQALYEKVVRLGTGGPNTGPYTAPLHTNPTGPSYLWGGLDVISLIDRYDDNIEADPGGVVFMSSSGSNLGKPEFSLLVPIYSGIGAPTKTALFRSQANLDRYVQMINDGSLLIMFGLNCQWGIISGPATDFAGRLSHWAQPGLGAIAVERFSKGRVTVLGLNLYSRGDDWHATKDHWKHAITAFSLLLTGPNFPGWEPADAPIVGVARERSEMPVIKVN